MIDQANAIIATYECEEMGVSQVSPLDGTVAFGSGYFGWAFNLQRFARMYAAKFKLDEKTLVKKLWGESYYNQAKKRFQDHDDDGAGGHLPRAFCTFVMKPVISLCRNIMSDEEGALDRVWAQLKFLNITIKS